MYLIKTQTHCVEQQMHDVPETCKWNSNFSLKISSKQQTIDGIFSKSTAFLLNPNVHLYHMTQSFCPAMSVTSQTSCSLSVPYWVHYVFTHTVKFLMSELEMQKQRHFHNYFKPGKDVIGFESLM